MFLDRPGRKEGLRPALLYIRDKCLMVAEHKKRYILFYYEGLGGLAGKPEDWMCTSGGTGWIRNALMGLDARKWLRDEFGLWWKADMHEHSGLLFTADPLTGWEWDRGRTTDRIHSYATYLGESAVVCAELRPKHRNHFRTGKKATDKVLMGTSNLKKLGDEDYLSLLGIHPDDDPKETA